MLTLETSFFLLAHKNKVNFDPLTKNKSISVLTLKPSQILSPLQKQVKFACPPTRKPSKFRSSL